MVRATSKEDKVASCLEKHPEWEDHRIANSCTVPIRMVRVARQQTAGVKTYPLAPTSSALKTTPQQTGGQKVGISKAEFMAQHDPTTRTRNMIAAAVKLIKPGHFIKDYELRKLAGCGDTGLWNAVASDPDEGFRKHRFQLDNSVWWTDARSRDEMLATNPKAKEA